MSTTETEPTTGVPGFDLNEMRFCHIFNWDDPASKNLCGCGSSSGSICGEWEGEAWCEDCDQPICPRCIQLSRLEDALDG